MVSSCLEHIWITLASSNPHGTVVAWRYRKPAILKKLPSPQPPQPHMALADCLLGDNIQVSQPLPESKAALGTVGGFDIVTFNV